MHVSLSGHRTQMQKRMSEDRTAGMAWVMALCHSREGIYPNFPQPTLLKWVCTQNFASFFYKSFWWILARYRSGVEGNAWISKNDKRSMSSGSSRSYYKTSRLKRRNRPSARRLCELIFLRKRKLKTNVHSVRLMPDFFMRVSNICVRIERELANIQIALSSPSLPRFSCKHPSECSPKSLW